MIDHAYLEACVKKGINLPEEDCIKCKRMLQLFLSDRERSKFKEYAWKGTNEYWTSVWYRFCKLISADDALLFNELFSYWFSGEWRWKLFSPREELYSCFLDFSNSCKDRILLQKAIDIIGLNNSSYSRLIEAIRKQIKLLEEDAIKQQITKTN